MKRIDDARLPTRFAEFRIEIFESSDAKEHAVIRLGDLLSGDPPLVRIHSECLTGDALFSLRCDCGFQLQAALGAIAHAGRGAVLYLRQEGRGIGLGNKIRAYALQDKGSDTVEANQQLGFPADAREYVVAGQLLRALGLSRIRLMTNNPKKIDAMTRDGIEIVERIPLHSGSNSHNEAYLRDKVDKMGHWPVLA
ncbi:GTP cyclohydrolase II [Panacagrimonas perspica]|uniref:GTP cyclohydrolase II n=1 Tax=Panacagrimonas perspica TaxID=381431 RepID=UPI00113947D3|nr:GTP cyclohydrolase II [Panacagrimonas perspica]THD02164.1 GTP cyclohydrolase II [Panacagrimonas perspica]